MTACQFQTRASEWTRGSFEDQNTPLEVYVTFAHWYHMQQCEQQQQLTTMPTMMTQIGSKSRIIFQLPSPSDAMRDVMFERFSSTNITNSLKWHINAMSQQICNSTRRNIIWQKHAGNTICVPWCLQESLPETYTQDKNEYTAWSSAQQCDITRYTLRCNNNKCVIDHRMWYDKKTVVYTANMRINIHGEQVYAAELLNSDKCNLCVFVLVNIINLCIELWNGVRNARVF